MGRFFSGAVILAFATTVNAANIAPIPGATGTPHSIVIAGSRAVIAGFDAHGAHLWVVNAVVPTAPMLQGEISTTIPNQPASGFLDVVLNPAGTLAVAAVGNQGIWVIDISNPADPRTVGTVTTPGLAYALALSGTTVYAACGTGHLQVISIANPAMPSILSSLTLQGYELDIALHSAMFCSDGTTVCRTNADCTAGTCSVERRFADVLNQNGSLHTVDVSNPAQPVLVRDLPLPRFSFHLAVNGKRGVLLSTNTTQSFLDVLDLSNPTTPVVAGSIVTGPLPGGTSVALSGTTASAMLPWGIQTYDVSTGTPIMLTLPDQTLTWINTGSAIEVGGAPLPLALAPIPGAPTPTPITPTPTRAAPPTPTQTQVATETVTPTPKPTTCSTAAPTFCS